MTIQEPVEAGDVRLGPNGPATIRDLRISLRAFSLQYATSEGWFGPYTDTEVAAMPLLCPARVRRGDGFARADGCLFTAEEEDPSVKGLWKNASTTSMRIHEACLHEGWRIVSRGPALQTARVDSGGGTLPSGIEAGRDYAPTIDDMKRQYLAAGIISQEEARSSRRKTVPYEPVKVGQVRLSANHGPVSVFNDHGFRLRTADGREVVSAWSPDAIAYMPLLCPAWEDIDMGDVFDAGSRGRLVIDPHQHRPSVRGRCLDSGWRLIARSSDVQQEQSPPCADVAQRKNNRPSTTFGRAVLECLPDGVEPNGQVAPPRPATAADWTTIDEPGALGSAVVCGVDMSTTGSHTVVVEARLGEDGKLRVEANAAHPALPHWLEVGGWCRLNGIAYESMMVHVVNDAAEVYLRSAADTFTYVLKVRLDHTMTASLAGLPIRELTASEARDAYAERRTLNRQRAAALCESPPRRALDGFGQKRGPAWQWYQGELSRMLNICNERTPPAIFVVEEIAHR